MGRQPQPEHEGVVALAPGGNIDEIRFENDMIEFIFSFSPGKQDYYHENTARQYFPPFSFFLFFKTDRTPRIIFQFILHFIPTCL